MSSKPAAASYRHKLSEAFATAARACVAEAQPDDLRAADRAARGLIDVSDFVGTLPADDARLQLLATFYPDPATMLESVRGRSSDPCAFRRDDPDLRIADYLDRLVGDVIDVWADWGDHPEAVSAGPLIALLEADELGVEWKLAAIGHLSDYLDFMEDWHVERAREEGLSWGRIAGPLRRSRQAVQQKHAWIEKEHS